MRTLTSLTSPSFAIRILVFLGGMAALSWEALWQLQASLALGISALGTALTLAATMGGMVLGSLIAGHLLDSRSIHRPIVAYGGLELAIGLSGMTMLKGFALLERIDSAIYPEFPQLAPIIHIAGIALVIGIPTLAMGATVPVLKLVATSRQTSLAILYALNTAGASIGVLLLSFVVLPTLGVARAVLGIAAVNALVFVLSLFCDRVGHVVVSGHHPMELRPNRDGRFPFHLLIVFVVGFSSFTLEVAWFRSLRAAFQSTTDSFAIMLVAVLVPLALAASSVPWLRRRRLSIAGCLAAGGAAILLVTPLLERVDLIAWLKASFWSVLAWRLLISLALLGPPMLLLGVALPWCLDEFQGPNKAGRLYAVNTLGAVVGSVAAAWIFLPDLGFARTSWLVGSIVLVLAIVAGTRQTRVPAAIAGGICLLVAINQTSSLGRDRIQADRLLDYSAIVAFEEDPDSTVAVVEAANGDRLLVIDGTLASGDFSNTHYMEWMGRLPVLLHAKPRDALVICFGSGQTANAVVQEGVAHLDVVDVSPAVFSMAPLFEVNEQVLRNPRVRSIVMDGRSWLRRTRKRYDVISLEPMPPNHAGVNALYSREFYELMRKRLQPGGVVAQWLPFFLLSPLHAASIAATFVEVFPDSILWMDPRTPTGILLGRAEATGSRLGWDWPGLRRSEARRTLSPDEIPRLVILEREGLLELGSRGLVISDDNQLLAYGRSRTPRTGQWLTASLAMVQEIAAKKE